VLSHKRAHQLSLLVQLHRPSKRSNGIITSTHALQRRAKRRMRLSKPRFARHRLFSVSKRIIKPPEAGVTCCPA
jgi:hypothetical protein